MISFRQPVDFSRTTILKNLAFHLITPFYNVIHLSVKQLWEKTTAVWNTRRLLNKNTACLIFLNKSYPNVLIKWVNKSKQIIKCGSWLTAVFWVPHLASGTSCIFTNSLIWIKNNTFYRNSVLIWCEIASDLRFCYFWS